jgi:hypothetical protein
LQRESDALIRPIAEAISLWLSGSMNDPASPATSGSEELPETITGHPAAKAWATGIPKPS